MRVAIVAESFLPNVNGVVNSVLRVIEHFDRAGHEAIIIAPGTPRKSPEAAPTDIDGVPVHHLPAVMLPRISSLPVGVPTMAMYHALADFAPDVVHLASPFVVGGAGAIAARKLGLPTVAIFQTDVAGFASSYGMSVASRAAWAWTRTLHKNVDRTLAPSSVSVNALRAQGIPRVHQWGRGVDIERFAPSRRDENLRRTWLNDAGRPDATVVGFVGRLAPEKHVERLASLSGRDDVQLVIVGDGPERRRLQTVLPDAVFTGELRGTELATAFASMDVFVHAGEHETFCQAVQEAKASGVPVIGPDAGGPRDLIAHCRTGYLLPVPEFSQRLVSAMDTLVDPTVRAEFGSAARKSVLTRTWPAICDQLLGHYNEVLGHGAGRYRRPA